MSLFQQGTFHLHSGDWTTWKIDCDFLTDEDIETLASIIGTSIWFEGVVGVPQGGLRLATALHKYERNLGAMLIVDDVLTTGSSMEAKRAELLASDPDMPIIGLVLFARGPCPGWIEPVFQLSPFNKWYLARSVQNG